MKVELDQVLVILQNTQKHYENEAEATKKCYVEADVDSKIHLKSFLTYNAMSQAINHCIEDIKQLGDTDK